MRDRRDDIRTRGHEPDTVAAARFMSDGRGDGTDGEMPPLPPRRVKFPSSKLQVARWFYNSLIVLFLTLMVGLFIYGHWIYVNGR